MAFGDERRWFASLPSTQSAALAAAETGAPEGTVVIAETQTAGRGRHGHSWTSPPGAGIYMSIVLRPPRPAAALLLLTLSVGLAVADAVEAMAGVTPELRWPNDLLLGDKKFCGLLIEMTGPHAALGIGINVKPVDMPADVAALATALETHAANPIARNRLRDAVLASVERRYAAWCDAARCDAANDAALRAEFENRCVMAHGVEVTVGGSGADPYQGTTAGLDESGFLRVRLADGSLRLVVHGDVRRRRVDG